MRDHLPNEVAALLDPDIPPEPVEGSFVDGEGAKTQCDALFRVQLRTGQPARIYVLLEHKSRVDGATPLQLARYMLNIWTRSLEENGASRSGRLPTIIPIVFYHGRGDWTAPLSLAEMIDAPEGVEDPLRGFAYTLRDLGQIEPLDLSRAPDVRAGLLALRLVYADTVPSELLDLMTGGPVDGSAFENHLLRYIVEKMNLTPPMLKASLRRTKPEDWETLMGTVAQAWLEQGEARGLEKGKAVGIAEGKAVGIAEGKAVGIAEGEARAKAETFLRQARLKFGEIPKARTAQVRAAASAELDAWLEALILAEDLDAVFAPRNDL